MAMKTRGIIGKRIAAIRQFRPGKMANVEHLVALDCIVLEDGTCLAPLVCEGESEYFVELIKRKTKFAP